MKTYKTKAAKDFCKAFGINPSDVVSFSYSVEKGAQFVIVPSVVDKPMTDEVAELYARYESAVEAANNIA